MKNLNTIILSSAICLFLATGCSQQRYSHVRKVRVNQEAKAPERKKSPEKQAVTPAEPIVQEVVALPPPSVPETLATVEVIPQETLVLTKPATSTKAKTRIFNKTVLPMIAKIEKKAEKALEPQEEEKTAYDSWLRLVIIGIILILIGVLLGALIYSPLGWIFTTIGFIIVVIGLIFLLLEAV